jgi:density-regulated protein DRP1
MADIEEDSGSGDERQEEAKDPQYPRIVVYCPSCTLPPEYCKYSQNFSRCKPWLAKNYPQLYPELADDPEVQAVTKQVDGVTIIDDNVISAEPSTGGKKGKKKDEGPLEIVISAVARTKKKYVTNIVGLSRFGIKLADASRVFAKKFAAASSVTTDQDEIVIQGEIADSLAEFLLKQYPEKINSSQVFILEDGHRRNMND